MAVSMTGFSRTQMTQQDWAVTIELKSVNNRYLDMHVRLPTKYQLLEQPIRKIVKSRISRGRIEISVSIEELCQKDRMVKIDKGIITELYSQWLKLQKELPLPSLSFEHIIQIPDVIQISDIEVDFEYLVEIVTEAVSLGVDKLNAMRRTEGEQLCEDLQQKAESIAKLVKEIQQRSPCIVEDYRLQLQERLARLIEGTSLTSERFEAEVAIFADRSCIDEEIVRLLSHIQQFHQSLHQNIPIGRKLDFLIQEMNREANTIGSKANDLHITKLVVELKSELERLREQVQNLE